MWKWTDGNDVQILILDSDSLNDEYLNFDYHNELHDVRILKVKNSFTSFGIKYNKKENVTQYSDATSLLTFILNEYNVESYSIIAISNSNQFLKEMIQNHIGTIFVGKLQENVFKYTPDFSNHTFRNYLIY